MEIEVILSNLRTTVDGGFKISFDVGDYEVGKIADLLSLRGQLLKIKIEEKEQK